jgi:hypothetical protein
MLKLTHVKRVIDYSELENITNEDIVTGQVCELLNVFEDCTEEISSERQVNALKNIVLLAKSVRDFLVEWKFIAT